jgi:glycosyltransferase involved in cell wall biosynthesis
MNVLVLDQFGTPGGAQQCLRDLVPAMIGRGWTVHAGVPPDGPLSAQLATLGAVTHEIPLQRYTNGRKSAGDMLRFAGEMPQLAGTLRRLMRQACIDVTYVNGPRILPAAALASDRILFHSHSLMGPRSATLIAAMSLRGRRAGAIASSRFVARPLAPYLPRERVRVVYNGVADHGAKSGPRLSGNWRIGIVGRVAPEKGHTDFVSAARLIAKGVADCEFLICGTPLHSGGDYLESIRKASRDLPITFRGWQDDIGPVLRELDVLAVPSTAVEATPRVVLEAFSAGLPVVAYAAGGIPELIEDGLNGILTREPSPASLAGAIQDLLQDPEKMERLSANARQSYEARFTLERFRHEVLAIVETLDRRVRR